MSRFTCVKRDNGNEVAYGLDHALGWFYQEFDEDGECVVDKDTLFSGLGQGELLHRLEQTTAYKGHLLAIACDKDPAVVGDKEGC